MGKKLKNRKYERTTACIRNSGFSAKSKVSAFNKSQYQTESEVLFNPLLLIHANRCDAILRYATNRVTSVDGLHPIMYSFHRYRSELRTSSNLLNKKYTQLRCYIFYLANPSTVSGNASKPFPKLQINNILK